MSKQLQTLKGSIETDSLGLILPHEHLFTDLRGPLADGYAQAEPSEVMRVVEPFLVDAFESGVTAFVECSTIGVGRNLEVLQTLSESTPIYILVPTGVYRDAFIPPALRDMSETDLAKLWISELMEGIEDTSIRAGFIKLAMSDDGPTELEKRNLRAAAQASKATGAVIASHTIGGRVAREEMDLLEQAGHDLQRFIWIHAQTEPDIAVLKAAAERGAFIELDSVGAPHQQQSELVETILALIESGYLDHILLSHDAGWYDPAHSNGLPNAGFRGYTALTKEFLPALSARGISEEQLRHTTVSNPARAFAF